MMRWPPRTRRRRSPISRPAGAQGAAGYFKSQNAELAYRVLTDSSVSDYLEYTKLGAEGDATSLDNLLAALDLIDECNALRAKEGLAPLKVSDTAMAAAMVQANAARGHYYHNQQYVNMMGTENLAWGPSEYDPYDGWWTERRRSTTPVTGIGRRLDIT